MVICSTCAATRTHTVVSVMRINKTNSTCHGCYKDYHGYICTYMYRFLILLGALKSPE